MSNLTSKLINDIELDFLTSFASLQVVIGSTANFLVIILFATTTELRRKNSDLLILHLSVADFISLSTFLPWNIYLTNIGRGEYSEYYTSLNTFCLFLSGTAVLTVAVDKFVAVIYPLRYPTLITRARTLLMILGSWLVATALVIAHFFDYLSAGEHHHILDKSLSALVLAKMLFVAVMYAVVFKAVRNQLSARNGRKVHVQNSSQITSKREKAERVFLKSALNTFIVVCLFYATYLPYAILQMMSVTDFVAWRRLFSFIYINACINPFIYFFRMRRFRIALLAVINKRKRFRDINAGNYMSTNKVSSTIDGEIGLRPDGPPF
ncbi:alpha-1A adrenergic receptor-like [Dendronephthya gigantea]|uniref:alpha-1A adrenergic receptor-like n=1 Tax=Dendronephthya gigantea TaxID=151771 RepID=UPI00106BCF54|nr:alpha-1A adrenergic receptor-like [Dendronephthya gigantea]